MAINEYILIYHAINWFIAYRDRPSHSRLMLKEMSYHDPKSTSYNKLQYMSLQLHACIENIFFIDNSWTI